MSHPAAPLPPARRLVRSIGGRIRATSVTPTSTRPARPPSSRWTGPPSAASWARSAQRCTSSASG